MEDAEVHSRLASIEEQIRILRSQIRRKKKDNPKRFVDLKGLWKGVDFTYEEIKEAEYRVKPFPE